MTNRENSVIAVHAGYTLTVTSWENDGDHYNTITKVFSDKQQALETQRFLRTMCKSGSYRDYTKIGNSTDTTWQHYAAIRAYFIENPYLVNEGYIHSISDDDDTLHDDIINELAGTYLGFSEYYDCRVYESSTLTYSAEDIYVDVVEPLT